MSEEFTLKPCPFCGGTAVIRREYPAGGMGGNGYYVGCPNCHMDGPFDLGHSGAIVAWNTRPIEDALLSRAVAAEAVCEAVEQLLSKAIVYQFVPPEYLTSALSNWKKARGEE